jgi:carbonic anhydrase
MKAKLHLTYPDATGTSYVKEQYNPLQFHFHAPSEHTIDGHLMDLEVHFVHTLTDDNNKYAVVGIFFDV